MDTGIQVQGDVALVRQIVQNLFSNAFKYCLPGSDCIRVELKAEGAWACLEVENACEPIGSTDRGILFDRFTRLDLARSREVEGSGLGLSLAREFAKAHGGDLQLAPFSSPDIIRFRLRLPLSADER